MSTPPFDPYADDPQPTTSQPDPVTQANPFTVAPPPDPLPANPFAPPPAPPPRNGSRAHDAAPAVPAESRAPAAPSLPPAVGVSPVTSTPPGTAPPGTVPPFGVPQQPNPSGPAQMYPILVPQLEPDLSALPPATTSPRTMSEPAPLPIPGPGGAREGQPVRIGLWGSGRSGKSTFLASLPLAAMQGRHGTWMVAGTDDDAAAALNYMVNRVAVEGRFPAGNMVVEGYSWTFHGTPPPAGFGSLLRALGVRRQPSAVDFTLEVFDPPGSYYRTGRVEPEALDHLANAGGLIYLVDPDVRRQRGDDSFQHFFGALQMLASRMATTGQLINGRLPQAIAVCVTKLDDDTFFRRVVTQTDMVSQDQDGHRLPRVPQERSREFFDWVCTRVLGGSASMVQEGLRAYFLPDRIQYFATSAIGFRLNHDQVFDFRDFRNVDQSAQELVIRERLRPVNVLEPLIYLEQRIRSVRR